jgi:hypothetical protein
MHSGRFQPMPCSECGEPLEARHVAHGTVWVCTPCGAGAATLGVIRRVAPRDFVRHLWQAARLHGRASARRCPSCEQPLLTFRDSKAAVSPEVEVCCRCFFVWLSRRTLASFSLEDRTRSATRGAIGLALAAAQGVAQTIESALDGPSS